MDTIVAVLPIGELEDELVRNKYEAMLSAFRCQAAELIVAEPTFDKETSIQAAQQLAQKNPDIIAVIALRGLSAQAIEAACLASNLPCVILPIQGRFALPSSVLALGAMRETTNRIEMVYGPPDHPEFIQRLGQVIKAAKAYSRLKRSRIGIVGGLFPNLVSCRYDSQIVSSRLGVTLIPFSFDTLRNSIQSVAGQHETVEQAYQGIAGTYRVDAADRNVLEAGISLHLALKKLTLDQNLIGFATECWSGFPGQLGLNPCMGFIEDDYALACEGDVMLCISQLIVRYLANRSAYVGDLYDLDLDGILTLTHCGAPASLASSKDEVILARSQLAHERGFETMTCRPRLDPGPVTIFRLYGSQCDKLHLALGELQGSEQTPNLTAKVKINAKRWDFLDQCFGNHYLVVHGDIRNELKLLCKWLDIQIFET
jgi:L-fucose isomerase-like protein